MTPTQIEFWALNIIERVIKKQPVEDGRVELKAQWIPPTKAARRIAGHANASRGADILWLIGVDEKSHKVIGATEKEFSVWWAQVKAQFDEHITPEIVDVCIPYNNKTVVALLLETSRAPFVVRNPQGGKVSREVPWREGTSVRTARRSDLIKMLVPSSELPDVELIGARFARNKIESNFEYFFEAELYVTPKGKKEITLPYHRCKVRLLNEKQRTSEFLNPRLFRPSVLKNNHESNASSLDPAAEPYAPGQVIIDRPGKVVLLADPSIHTVKNRMPQQLFFNIDLLPAGFDQGIPVDFALHKATESRYYYQEWDCHHYGHRYRS